MKSPSKKCGRAREQSGSKHQAYKVKGKLGPNATKMKKQNEGTSRNINLKVYVVSMTYNFPCFLLVFFPTLIFHSILFFLVSFSVTEGPP
jgi:hypothetical protein